MKLSQAHPHHTTQLPVQTSSSPFLSRCVSSPAWITLTAVCGRSNFGSPFFTGNSYAFMQLFEPPSRFLAAQEFESCRLDEDKLKWLKKVKHGQCSPPDTRRVLPPYNIVKYTFSLILLRTHMGIGKPLSPVSSTDLHSHDLVKNLAGCIRVRLTFLPSPVFIPCA